MTTLTDFNDAPTLSINDWTLGGHKLRYEQSDTAGRASAFATTAHENISRIRPFTGDQSWRVISHGGEGLNPHLYFKSQDVQMDLRDFLPGWTQDTLNRGRLYIYLPEGTRNNDWNPGRTNFHIGTYARLHDAPPNNSEGPNGHWYHYYSPPIAGGWNTFYMDWKPTHRRGGSGGSDEHDDTEYPYPIDSPGWNYFDLLCRLYLRSWLRNDSAAEHQFPMAYFIDQIEFWEDTNNEIITHTSCMCGGWEANTDQYKLNWVMRKADTEIEYDIRYAYSDVHVLGWENLEEPTNERFSRDGQSGFHAQWESVPDEIDSSQDFIYFAIRCVDPDVGFRQIIIPTRSGLVPPV